MNAPCTHRNSSENDRVAVIVETRDAFFLPLVIKNAADKLGNEWNTHIFAPPALLATLRGLFPNCAFTTTKLHVEPPFTSSKYSALLRRPSFWNAIREETILIFQLDTLFLRGIPKWAEEYDYIGAPCGEVTEDKVVFNGGLSLRKKAAMLRTCGGDDTICESEPEDVYYTRKLRNHGGKLPSVSTALRFACESLYHEDACGVHGTDKYYINPEVIFTEQVRRASH
ncbi:hypothetical protein JKP88DRAFT_157159 [Tribonema minus]|uniref:DUF5672 domain-containing protein n=1 Tax=Tribonema minus TaxID=303371 RepID=A0A835ZA04_9STRA|nr:hypothetical protein JKP88DRAFT_157159 [Tribonema minus]